MSGGGGGGGSSDEWRSELGGGLSGKDKCAIVELTALNSPVRDVVSGLSVGGILHVELETSPRNRIVVRDIKTGEIAGAITSPRLVDLIECIQGDYAYEAEVKSITGGRIEIEIRPA